MESDEKTQKRLEECVGGGGTKEWGEEPQHRRGGVGTEDTEESPSLVAKAISYLRSSPLDYAGCAKSLGITFYLMRKLRKQHAEEFDLEEEQYFSQLEKLVALDALGRELPPGFEGFEFSKAMKVLERRKREWAASQKQLAPEAPKVDLSYKDVLREHMEKEFGLNKSIRSGSA